MSNIPESEEPPIVFNAVFGAIVGAIMVAIAPSGSGIGWATGIIFGAVVVTGIGLFRRLHNRHRTVRLFASVVVNIYNFIAIALLVLFCLVCLSLCGAK